MSELHARSLRQRLVALLGVSVIVGVAMGALWIAGLFNSPAGEAATLVDTPPVSGAEDLGIGSLAGQLRVFGLILAGVLALAATACGGTANSTPPTGATGGSMGGDRMGQMMGSAMANAPGSRLPESTARTLGDTSPTGASVNVAQRVISFQSKDVSLWVLASPDWGTDMTFRIAGLSDPTLIVPQGATVIVHFVNADVDTSHGWLLTPAAPPFSFMAMMSAPPAVSGAFAPPLGDATSVGMPVETVSFMAAAAGHYTYLCPVPGHAQRGMYGVFLVQ
jgi:rusticyanin